MPQKTDRKKHRGLLLFGTSLLFLSLVFGGINFWCETRGIPEFLVNGFKRILARQDIFLRAKNIRAGVWNGIRVDSLELAGPNAYEYPLLRADRLQIRFTLLKLLRGAMIPFHIVLENAVLELPIFPENGVEGSSDILRISGIYADLSGAPGLLVVDRMEGEFAGFRFTGSGTIDNLLHAAGARGSLALQRSLSHEDEEKTTDRRKEPEQILPLFAEYIAGVPLKLRRNLAFFQERMKYETFEKLPCSELRFAIDLNSFYKSVLNAKISFPAFRYGYLKVGSLNEEIVLENGTIRFSHFKLALGDGEYISGSGTYNASKNNVSCLVAGVCSPEKILLFLDDSSRKSISDKLHFKDDSKLTFTGQVENFSFRNNEQIGTLELEIPGLMFHKLEMQDVKVHLTVNDNLFDGRILSAVLPGNGRLNGTFTIRDKAFACEAYGSALPFSVENFLSPKAIELIRKNIAFSSPDSLLGFSGTLRCEDWDKSEFTGAFDLTLPAFTCKNLAIERSSMLLDFSPERLKSTKLEAVLDSSTGTRASGEITCLPENNTLFASILSKGSPDKAFAVLEPGHRTFIESLTRDIQWPENRSLTELNADILIRLEPYNSYYLAGSIVMTDFKYRNIPLKYGAARFIIDSNNTMILPAAILETKDGHAVMSIAYNASEQPRPPDSVALSIAGGTDKMLPGGSLDFSLQSTLSGNDLIRCLYPAWKSSNMDFPKRMNVRASGMIDYRNREKTFFVAEISNSSCYWLNAPIRNIDASIHYASNTLSFSHATAEFCGGNTVMDFTCDFNTGKGLIHTELTDARLSTVLDGLGCKDIIDSANKEATVSGELDSVFSYNEEKKIRMNGEGVLTIHGENLWSIPLLGGFLKYLGNAWSLENFGSITNIHCDFKLDGAQVIAEKFRSDGGIVALAARGKYSLDTNEFDLKFRAELLKAALPFEVIPKLLYPVSWILERRLTGKFSDYKWE